MLPEFELYSPERLDDCLALLAQWGEQALPVAGGTNLIPDLRSGRARPRVVIDLGRLAELSYVRCIAGRVAIGAGATVAGLLQSPLLDQMGAAIGEAARVLANPLVRNRATVAGNLADASPAADLAPPLLALGAEVILTSVNASRCLPLSELFLGPRKTARRPDELLTEIRYPAPDSAASTFIKLGLRQADAIAIASVATFVEMSGASVRVARIALGSVAPRPLRALHAEQALIGRPLDEETVRQAAAVAAQEDASPIDDLRASAEYRRWMVEVLVRRALRRVLG